LSVGSNVHGHHWWWRKQYLVAHFVITGAIDRNFKEGLHVSPSGLSIPAPVPIPSQCAYWSVHQWYIVTWFPSGHGMASINKRPGN
jgi:hypothetical protein